MGQGPLSCRADSAAFDLWMMQLFASRAEHIKAVRTLHALQHQTQHTPHAAAPHSAHSTRCSTKLSTLHALQHHTVTCSAVCVRCCAVGVWCQCAVCKVLVESTRHWVVQSAGLYWIVGGTGWHCVGGTGWHWVRGTERLVDTGWLALGGWQGWMLCTWTVVGAA